MTTTIKSPDDIYAELAPLLRVQRVRTRRKPSSPDAWYPLNADAWFVGACMGPDARDSAPCMARLRKHARPGTFAKIMELCAQLGAWSIAQNPAHCFNDRTARNVARCREVAAEYLNH